MPWVRFGRKFLIPASILHWLSGPDGPGGSLLWAIIQSVIVSAALRVILRPGPEPGLRPVERRSGLVVRQWRTICAMGGNAVLRKTQGDHLGQIRAISDPVPGFPSGPHGHGWIP